MFDIAMRCIVFITGENSFWHFTASQVIHSLLLYILGIIPCAAGSHTCGFNAALKLLKYFMQMFISETHKWVKISIE